MPAEDPLWRMENVVLTPHISGRSFDPYSAAVIYDIYADNLRRYFAGEPLLHVVDTGLGY